MTIKFKKNLNTVPGDWIALDPMEQKPVDLEPIYQEFKKHVGSNPIKTLSILDDLAPTPQSVKEPLMYIFTLVVLTTTAEEKPKWGIWDSQVTSDSHDFISSFKAHQEVQEDHLKDKSITGYQIISMKVSNTTDTCSKLPDYCISRFEPKPKVYINGPKKNNEFLTKKAKQYANAKSI